MQQQLGLDSESSNEDSAADQDESGEEEQLMAEPTRRQRSAKTGGGAGRRSLLSRVSPSTTSGAPSDPNPEPNIDPSSDLLQGWGGSRLSRRVQDPHEDLSSVAAAEALALGLGLSPIGHSAFAPGALPALGDSLGYGKLGNLDPRQGSGQVCSPFQSSHISRVRAGPSGPAEEVASLEMPVNLPYSSTRGSSLAPPGYACQCLAWAALAWSALAACSIRCLSCLLPITSLAGQACCEAHTLHIFCKPKAFIRLFNMSLFFQRMSSLR